MDLLLFLLGAVPIAALVRWWRPRLGLAEAAGFTLLAAAFFAVPLATPALQVPTDLAYTVRPWSETVPEAVVPRNPLLSDIPQQMLPFRTLVRQRLLALEAPLWAHGVGTGQPLLGNAQSAPFAAIHWLALPLPPVRALTLAVAWQVLLALLLADALVLAVAGPGVRSRGGRDGTEGERPLPATRLGAAFGAVAFAFSTYLVAWAYHPLGMAAAWLPGIFLGLLALRRGERGGLAGLVVCGVGMATSGHPETLAHTAVACAPVALALLISRRGIPRARFAARLAGAAALSALLAAPALLPVLEALPESERAAVLEGNPRSVHPPPFEGRMLWTLTDPLFFGSPRDRNWNGPFNFNELASGYAGLAALALAVAAAAALGGWRAAVLAGGAAFLLAAFKIEPFFGLVEAVPEVGDAAHGRLKLFWVLAVAVAAGSGLPALARERRGRWAAGAALVAAGAALLVAPPPGSPESFWQRAWAWGALAGVAACLAALAVPRWRRAFPAVALGALVLDLFLLGVRFHPVVPAGLDLAPPAAVAWLMERSAEAAEPFRVIGERSDLMPNTAALYGLWDPRGNDPMRPAAPATLVGRRMLHKYRIGRRVQIVPGNYPAALLDFLGVRYVLTRHHARLPAPLERVWNGPGGRLWENPRALPPFFLPERVEPSPDGDDALERAAGIADFRRLAIVEGGAEAGGQSGTARIAELTPNGFELEIVTPTGGFVASSVSHAPGWRLEVAGRPVPVQRVNGGFVGFRVDPGSHRARLEYRPASWAWGVRLGILGLALSAALAWRAWRSSRPRRVGTDLL